MNEREICIIFAKNLSRIISEKNITQTDIAKALGIAKSTVSEWCSGKNVPRTKALNKLCAYLRVDLSDLLTEKVSDVPIQTPTQAELHALVDTLTPEQQEALLVVARQFDTARKPQ